MQIKAESETEFSWYLQFDTETNLKTEKKMYSSFVISFNEALKYRNKRKQLLRQQQYQILTVKIYI